MAVAVLTGCASAPVGQGPIKFSPKVQAYYDQYRRSTTPGAFVISEQGGAFYTYCASMDCRAGAVSQAIRLCRRHDAGECYVYDIGGRVVWQENVTPSINAEAVETGLTTERGRNALKVDCTEQLKANLPSSVRADLATSLGVKDSRVPWTACDRLVEGLASDRISSDDFIAAQRGQLDSQRLESLLRLGPGAPSLST